ncbi:MAG: SurA N-terminal domain-containing protein [Pseudomonadota bacterium]|nr:SurA N-terminal domain-containing protein [Pseudomonadota bacterium]
MNKLKTLFFVFSFLLVNTSYSFQDSVVAIVNDKVILQSELEEKMQEFNIQNLSRIELAKIKNGILDQLIEESLLDQASSRMGIRISDIDLQNSLKLIAKNQGLTVLQLKDAVEKQNISYVKYLDKVRRNIQRQELFRTQFTNRAYVSDEEIESF